MGSVSDTRVESAATERPFPVEIVGWRRVTTHSTLKGWASVRFGASVVFNDVGVYSDPSGKRWVMLPSKKCTNADGTPKLSEKTGKQLWQPLVEIRSKDTAAKFRDGVFASLERQYPGDIGPAASEASNGR